LWRAACTDTRKIWRRCTGVSDAIKAGDGKAEARELSEAVERLVNG
jgi:hypothetical protein